MSVVLTFEGHSDDIFSVGCGGKLEEFGCYDKGICVRVTTPKHDFIVYAKYSFRDGVWMIGTMPSAEGVSYFLDCTVSMTSDGYSPILTIELDVTGGVDQVALEEVEHCVS